MFICWEFITNCPCISFFHSWLLTDGSFCWGWRIGGEGWDPAGPGGVGGEGWTLSGLALVEKDGTLLGLAMVEMGGTLLGLALVERGWDPSGAGVGGERWDSAEAARG